MNLCIISPSYPTKSGRGGYFFVEELVKQFVILGHNCTIIAPVNIATKYFIARPYGKYYDYYEFNKSFIEVYRPRYYGRDIRLFGVSWANNRCQRAIEKVIKKHHLQIDLIYGHFFRSAVVAWRYAFHNNIPLFVATGESSIPSIVKPCRDFTIESFQHYLAGVICVSTKNKDEAIKLNYADDSQCAVFPNGVNLSLFIPKDKIECRRKLGLPEDKFIVVCAGNYTERKGQSRIVRAVESLKDPSIGVVLVGRGNEVLESDYILYKGFVNHDDVPTYLNAADVYVLPTRWEGCCNSIIEAMACGLPIVSSDRSFNWDILNKENAILIDPDNIEQIAESIKMFCKDKNFRQSLSNKSLEQSRSLSIEERAKNILAFIEERINNNHNDNQEIH